MDFTQEYKQKLVTADEAVKTVRSGDWVDYGWCTNCLLYTSKIRRPLLSGKMYFSFVTLKITGLPLEFYRINSGSSS